MSLLPSATEIVCLLGLEDQLVGVSADHAAAAAHGWQVARTIVSQGQYDVVVLDEVLAAVTAGLVPLDELVEMVRSKPSQLHLVLTGRNAPAELIEVADLVSEVQPIKHPFDKGIKAQRGIEF